jgi:glutamate/tyrosine decarboxylase-like PLP-dependent enzyme
MSKPIYREQLKQIREAFPSPRSDRLHDAYFVFSIMRALDQVDDMKSEVPLLGTVGHLDYVAAESERIADAPSTVEDVTRELVKTLEGMPIWGHPRTQINVVPPPTIPGIVGTLLASIYNPNLVSDDTSQAVELAEHRAAAMTAALIGYDPSKSTGVFTFGGTGTTLYGVRIGIEKAIPESLRNGVGSNAVIIASGQSHYARLNVAGWLGLGEKNVISVPTDLTNAIRVEVFTTEARRAIESGRRIAAIIVTMGTTDAFGIDDLAAIVEVRDRLVEEYELDYCPHIHADAVIGWAWSVFNAYDFDENPLGFRPRAVRALADAGRRISKLCLADSVGIDFHKTGFTPYISSLFLVRNRADMELLVRGRDEMPYLFQTGERHPGIFTLETSRSGAGALAALANLMLFGRRGLQVILGHLVEMAELLREHFEGHRHATVLNSDNVGTVTLFRVYPDDVDTWTLKDREQTDPSSRDELLAHNEYNRRVFHYLHEQAMEGKGVRISMTDCYRHTSYGEPIVALKSYMLSPFIDEDDVECLVAIVLEAREHIESVR